MASLIQRKVCMLGAFAVGKTSLVRRFVDGQFQARYDTTIGVSIHSHEVEQDGARTRLVLWDLPGEDAFQFVEPAYLRGSAGQLLVVDATRPDTLDTAVLLHERAKLVGAAACCAVLLNKVDLEGERAVGVDAVRAAFPDDVGVHETSAKEDRGVRDAFASLVRRMAERSAR